MEKIFLSRQYLESVSTADLIALADDYGIDIPDNLNRRFIIGELLEAADEIESSRKSDKNVHVTDDNVDIPQILPATYNETQITAILRNPAWVFVFWDIKESDLKLLQTNLTTVLNLHITFYETYEMVKATDSFDIQVSLTDREQYVLLPGGKQFFKIDLVYVEHNAKPSILTSTRCIEIPQGCTSLSKLQPGKDIRMNSIMKLSGMEQLLHDHYNNHRQSFL